MSAKATLKALNRTLLELPAAQRPLLAAMHVDIQQTILSSMKSGITWDKKGMRNVVQGLSEKVNRFHDKATELGEVISKLEAHVDGLRTCAFTTAAMRCVAPPPRPRPPTTP